MEREDAGRVCKAALKVITIPVSPSRGRSPMDEDIGCGYSGSIVQELVQKAALVSELRGHSNVVAYENHQVIQHRDGTGWDILIQMELLTPLNDYLRQKKALSRQEILRLGIDLCKALEVCRRYGIFHGDIKPGNIFVSESGTFKLGDFGTARLPDGTSHFPAWVTQAYMAPEIYKGMRCGFPADLYSLGLVLYQLLNDNRLPFLPPAPSPVSLADREQALRQRLSGAPLPMPSHADRQLWAVLEKVSAYNPGDRYADPLQLRQALEQMKAGSPAPPAEGRVLPLGHQSLDPGSHVQGIHYTWPASWRAEDIRCFSAGFGDLPIRCFTCDGEILTARNEINVSRDGGRNFPEGFFDPVTLSLTEKQKEELGRCLEALPLERWASFPPAVECDLQSPTGYRRHVYFSCEMKNGDKFDYLPGRKAAPGFVRLCHWLAVILPE